MSREVCYTCRRAKVACLCKRIEKQTNRISVTVLQHPDEVNNPKGSAIIAKLGLKEYQCWVGEDFTQHRGLSELLKTVADDVLLLYPAEQAEVLLAGRAEQVKHLLIIDATWRKARRIWECNPQLKLLRCAKLAADRSSNYRIRKVPQAGYLSTIESVVEALRVLEGKADAYQPLLQLFDEMIDYQIQSMGSEVFERNYDVSDDN